MKKPKFYSWINSFDDIIYDCYLPNGIIMSRSTVSIHWVQVWTDMSTYPSYAPCTKREATAYGKYPLPL